MDVNIPQIPVHKGGIMYFQKGFFMHLPPSKLFGALNLRFIDYHYRHEYMNELLRNIYTQHALEKQFMETEREIYSIKESHHRILYNTETLIYWTRKNTDEFIMLLYYMYKYATDKKEPHNLAIRSIGHLLNAANHGNAFVSLFTTILDDLKTINNISNTMKHSFITSETHRLIGIDEPTVNCLQLKDNNATNPSQYYSYFLRDIISLYVNCFDLIVQKLEDYA